MSAQDVAAAAAPWIAIVAGASGIAGGLVALSSGSRTNNRIREDLAKDIELAARLDAGSKVAEDLEAIVASHVTRLRARLVDRRPITLSRMLIIGGAGAALLGLCLVGFSVIVSDGVAADVENRLDYVASGVASGGWVLLLYGVLFLLMAIVLRSLRWVYTIGGAFRNEFEELRATARAEFDRRRALREATYERRRAVRDGKQRK